MKRFIDLRGQIIDDEPPHYPMFAFYDTVVDEFERINGESTWSDRTSFFRDCRLDGRERDLSRYSPLIPGWVPMEET